MHGEPFPTMTHRIFAPHGSTVSAPACTLLEALPLTVWLTGLSGAGKSTLADGAQRWLSRLGIRSLRIDGDQLRAGICQDLRFSAEDRHENVRRAGLSEILCLGHNMSPRSMYATQNQDQPGC